MTIISNLGIVVINNILTVVFLLAGIGFLSSAITMYKTDRILSFILFVATVIVVCLQYWSYVMLGLFK